MLHGLMGGIGTVFQPMHLLILIIGILLGFWGGAIPGISGTMVVVILLPITYGMGSESAFLLLTSIYATAVFSGSISAILFRTPGAPESVATVFDGYPMAKRGEAGRALGLSIFSSASGGIIGTIILIFLTPLLASVALKFSSTEYFALALLALSAVASLGGGNFVKAMIGVFFGLFVSTIGIDPITGINRFTFHTSFLQQGLNFIPILIGLFAISEVFRKVQEHYEIGQNAHKVLTKLPDLKTFKRIRGVIASSSLLGVLIGILPGVGATTASMLSYSAQASWSKRSKEFGTGIPEGIAAPETANNAAAMGAMVPLLSLGIPGSGTTAVLLGAFILHGIQPGPLLFNQHPGLVYTIFIGLLIANLAILLLSKPFISIFAQTAKVPYFILGPLIVIFCIVGTYAVRNSMLDVWMMFIFGLLGYFLEKVKFPLAPIVLGVVLGNLTEVQFRTAMLKSSGNPGTFFTHPISAVLIILAFISFLVPLFRFINRKKDKDQQTPPVTLDDEEVGS